MDITTAQSWQTNVANIDLTQLPDDVMKLIGLSLQQIATQYVTNQMNSISADDFSAIMTTLNTAVQTKKNIGVGTLNPISH